MGRAHRRCSGGNCGSRAVCGACAAGVARRQGDAPGRLEPARRLLPKGRGRRGEGRCGERHGRRARDERRAPAGFAGATRGPARGARRGDGYRRAGGRLSPLQVIVAAVDLGSNTTRLLVGRVEDGRVDELHRETRITRLGEGVDSRKRLLPVPIARVRNVLTDYRRTAEEFAVERTLAVATSAVRDVENGEAFLGEIEWSYGFTAHLVSGDEEAQLTKQGVQPDADTLVLDIGGGSTELILDDFHVSLPVGAIRFTERHGEEIERIKQETTKQLPELDPRAAIGVSGTVTTLAALDLQLEQYDRERVDGHGLTRAAAAEQLHR